MSYDMSWTKGTRQDAAYVQQSRLIDSGGGRLGQIVKGGGLLP